MANNLYCTRNSSADIAGRESQIDNTTLYNITDDTDITLSLLQTIYPVGSIYITTNNTCPLSALFGTWQLVGADRVLQGAGTRGTVGTTLEESLPSVLSSGKIPIYLGSGGSASLGSGSTITISKSYINPVYQDNAPVQPDAYLVNIYRRIA